MKIVLKLTEDCIHIRDADMFIGFDMDETYNMLNSVQILYDEMSLDMVFQIPTTSKKSIKHGYYAIRRRMKLR